LIYYFNFTNEKKKIRNDELDKEEKIKNMKDVVTGTLPINNLNLKTYLP